MAIRGFIQFFQKTYRLQVLSPAALIGYPFAFCPRIIEVQHGSHRIHPQAVGVVPVQPKQRIANQKRSYFVSPVVEDKGTPIGVVSLSWIGMLIQVGTVESVQTMRVAWKV